MMEEKKMEEKKNKAVAAEENKVSPSPLPSPAGRGGKVWIRFFPGRAGDGVEVQADGSALADADQAAYWVKIGYAEYMSKGE